MPSQPAFASPFPRRLHLSDAASSELRRLAHGLVTDAVDEYEHFLWRQHSTVSSTQWTVAREHDDVRVYRQATASVTPTQHKMQELLAVGSLTGELDDALYGALGATTATMRLRAAYTTDRVTHGAVLATLKRPTRAKPFRALTVQWLVRSSGRAPLALTMALPRVGKPTKRDLVVLESTGTRTLTNGEMVGFQLVHSVDLADTPPLPSYVRANLSLCTLWRQTSDDRVHVYARAFVGAGDRATTARSTKATTDALVCGARVIHCAQMKKLAWLMRCKASLLGGRSYPLDRRAAARTSSSSSSADDRSCEVCPSQLTMHVSQRRSARAVCAVCTRLVCSDCRVKRTLSAVPPDGTHLREQRLAFCVPCHTTALRAAAADVAGEEAASRVSEEAEHPFARTHGPSLVFVPGVIRDDDDQSDQDDAQDDVDAIDRVYDKSPPASSGATLEDYDDDDDDLRGSRRGASGLTPMYYILGDL